MLLSLLSAIFFVQEYLTELIKVKITCEANLVFLKSLKPRESHTTAWTHSADGKIIAVLEKDQNQALTCASYCICWHQE